MSEPKAVLTWTVVEDDATWQSIQSATKAEASTQAVRTMSQAEWRFASMIAVLFLLLGGGWVWYRQVTHATIAGELHRTIQNEVGAAEAWYLPGQPVLAAGLSTSLSNVAHSTSNTSLRPSAPDVQILTYHTQSDQALAQVKISYPTPAGEILTYRETRFYRQTEGWRRIEPVFDLMGPWQMLETKYFTIRHRAIDDLAVREAAPRLDLLYEQMRRDFELPHSAGTPIAMPSTIKLVLAYGPWNEYDTSLANHTIIVPSPTMLSIPLEMTDALVFYQSVVYPLASLTLADLYGQYPSVPRIGLGVWRPIVGALRLWEVWNTDGPLTEGRQIVIGWLYQNAQAGSSDAYRIMPAEYERLCRLYRVWKLSPVAMAIPIYCSDADESVGAVYSTVHPTRLNELTMGVQQHISQPVAVVDSTIAMETVLEYVVATYGRDHLPRLITAMDEHKGWVTLIPAVFGISTADFEKGWQAYLADQYGRDEAKMR